MQRKITKPQLPAATKLAEKVYFIDGENKLDIENFIYGNVSISEITKDLSHVLNYILTTSDCLKMNENMQHYFISYVAFYFCENNKKIKKLTLKRRIRINNFLCNFYKNLIEATELIHNLTPDSTLTKEQKKEEIYQVFSTVVFENISQGQMPFDTIEHLYKEAEKPFMFDCLTYIKIYHTLLTIPTYKYKNTYYLVKAKENLLMQLMNNKIQAIELNEEEVKDLLAFRKMNYNDYQLYKNIHQYIKENQESIVTCEQKEKIRVFRNNYEKWLTDWGKSTITLVSAIIKNDGNTPLYVRIRQNRLDEDEENWLLIGYILSIVLSNQEAGLLTEKQFNLVYLAVTQLSNEFSDTYANLCNFISKVEGGSCSSDKACYIVSEYIKHLILGKSKSKLIETSISNKEYSYHLPILNDFVLWKDIVESLLLLTYDSTNLLFIQNSLQAKARFYEKSEAIYMINADIEKLCSLAVVRYKNDYLLDKAKFNELQENITVYVNEMTLSNFVDRHIDIFDHKSLYNEMILPYIKLLLKNQTDNTYVLNKNYLYGDFEKDKNLLHLLAKNILQRMYLKEKRKLVF